MSEILVHIDGSDGWAARAARVRDLANALGGNCRGFTVGALPMAPYGPGAESLQSIYQDASDTIRARAHDLARQAIKELGIEVDVVVTASSRVLIDCASLFRASYFVAVSQPTSPKYATEESIFDAALFLSGRPALVMPRAEPKPIGRNIVIAWKDCRESARAVHDAIPILQRAETVRLLSITGEEDERFFGQAASDRMTAALKLRSVPVQQCVVKSGDGGAAETLLREAADADLLVMGAFGRWRLAERMFGGFTRHAIEKVQIPIFMAH